MLLSENLLKSLLVTLRYADKLGCLSFQWNQVKHCFQLKPPRKQTTYKIRCVFAQVYTFLTTVQVICTWKDVDLFVKLHTVAILSGQLMCCYTMYIFYTQGEQITSLLNAMVMFEKTTNGNGWVTPNSFYPKLVSVALFNMLLSGYLLPFLYHLDMMYNPCLPTHLFGYIVVHTQCDGSLGTNLQPTWSVTEIQQKTFVVFLSYLNWSFLGLGCSIQVILVIILKCYCLRSYIQLVGNKFQTRIEDKLCLLYRELQIFGEIYREIYAKYFIAVVMSVVMGFYILGLYVTIKFAFGMSFRVALMFTVLASDGFICTMMGYSTIANVNKNSELLLKTMKQAKTKIHKSAFLGRYQRFVKSCRLITVYIGDLNYVEVNTPLVVQDFVINQTVNLLLMD